MFTLATFYHLVPIQDPKALQQELTRLAALYVLKGTVLVTPEGLNGTLSGQEEALKRWFEGLGILDSRFASVRVQWSVSDKPPYARLKIKYKPEVVPLGMPLGETSPRGISVPPEEWDALIGQPDVWVLDTRNDYEVAVGTFPGAMHPGSRHFSEFPVYVARTLDPKQHKRVAMFCTGGIRCEKASAYLLEKGFDTVYQLDGGILNYLNTLPPEKQQWQGDCFVFDERVTVTPTLAPGSYTFSQTGMPVETIVSQPV